MMPKLLIINTTQLPLPHCQATPPSPPSAPRPIIRFNTQRQRVTTPSHASDDNDTKREQVFLHTIPRVKYYNNTQARVGTCNDKCTTCPPPTPSLRACFPPALPHFKKLSFSSPFFTAVQSTKYS